MANQPIHSGLRLSSVPTADAIEVDFGVLTQICKLLEGDQVDLSETAGDSTAQAEQLAQLVGEQVALLPGLASSEIIVNNSRPDDQDWRDYVEGGFWQVHVGVRTKSDVYRVYTSKVTIGNETYYAELDAYTDYVA